MICANPLVLSVGKLLMPARTFSHHFASEPSNKQNAPKLCIYTNMSLPIKLFEDLSQRPSYGREHLIYTSTSMCAENIYYVVYLIIDPQFHGTRVCVSVWTGSWGVYCANRTRQDDDTDGIRAGRFVLSCLPHHTVKILA